ncbi:hypothetical protein FLONG3_11332 [Fusarium longipes]|uniref:Uncharacterized protein n=1 Tax=Fusarium longipes TaxID=694270 RepID=A0A395RFU7_9HYPO|nr:hypothetical protein FLONG3_11332 [Fusarium longipes]
MDAFQENAAYNGNLVDQAFTVLTNNGGQCPPEHFPILREAARTIHNHIGGVVGLTKVECKILMEFAIEVNVADQLPVLQILDNQIRAARPKHSMTEGDNEFLEFIANVRSRIAEEQIAAAQLQHVNEGLIPVDESPQPQMPGIQNTTEMHASHVDEAGMSTTHSIFLNVMHPDGTTMSTSSFTVITSATPGMFPVPNVPANQAYFAPFNTDNVTQEVGVVSQGFMLGGVDFDVPAIEQAMELDAMNATPGDAVYRRMDFDQV